MRKPVPADNVFKPKLSHAELRVDATTRAAHAIMDEEASTRIAKTERLRAVRLAKEATEGPNPIKKILEKKPRRKS
ncbi:MAG: hypothetical protein J0H84_17420 [Rhizobiales bacterium]|jgi:hypothetical protein|nr:hypothetical protein [Hyphomicrobiales bacterium]